MASNLQLSPIVERNRNKPQPFTPTLLNQSQAISQEEILNNLLRELQQYYVQPDQAQQQAVNTQPSEASGDAFNTGTFNGTSSGASNSDVGNVLGGLASILGNVGILGKDMSAVNAAQMMGKLSTAVNLGTDLYNAQTPADYAAAIAPVGVAQLGLPAQEASGILGAAKGAQQDGLEGAVSGGLNSYVTAALMSVNPAIALGNVVSGLAGGTTIGSSLTPYTSVLGDKIAEALQTGLGMLSPGTPQDPNNVPVEDRSIYSPTFSLSSPDAGIDNSSYAGYTPGWSEAGSYTTGAGYSGSDYGSDRSQDALGSMGDTNND